MPTCDPTSSAAPASDRLRTTQHIDMSPNLIKPGSRTRRRLVFRASAKSMTVILGALLIEVTPVCGRRCTGHNVSKFGADGQRFSFVDNRSCLGTFMQSDVLPFGLRGSAASRAERRFFSPNHCCVRNRSGCHEPSLGGTEAAISPNANRR